MVCGGMKRKVSVLLPFASALVSVLAACGPPAGSLRTTTESAGAESAASSTETTGGQAYVPAQELAHEHELSAALQQLVEERTRDVQRLRAEVEQLRQQETDLRAALDRALAAGKTGSAGSAGSETAAGNAAAEASAPTQEEKSREVAAAEQARQESEQQHAAMVARLQDALAQEQQRREQVETELSRLKQETSSPPYGENHAGEAELRAAKQQVTELRTALEQERAARERLAEDFRALQQRAEAESAGGHADVENAQLRQQLKQLEDEKQSVAESFNRSLAESQQRAAELEEQLTKARATEQADAGSDGKLADIRAENDALRARLDEEHRHTEELAGKLKVAMRVTDLIFKMQAQPK
jgi:predicted RNase H-like nuclease (RuvC/YqgF family)